MLQQRNLYVPNQQTLPLTKSSGKLTSIQLEPPQNVQNIKETPNSTKSQKHVVSNTTQCPKSNVKHPRRKHFTNMSEDVSPIIVSVAILPLFQVISEVKPGILMSRALEVIMMIEKFQKNLHLNLQSEEGMLRKVMKHI